MLTVAVCNTKSGKHGERIIRALCEGIAANGDAPLLIAGPVDLPLIPQCHAAVMVCDGHPERTGKEFDFRNAVTRACLERGLDRLIIETGFIRNARAEIAKQHDPRQTRWAAGWNGIKRAADYCVPEDAGKTRWKALRVPPVPEDGRDPHGNVLVFGQVDGGYAEIGLSMMDEYHRVITVCRAKLPGVSVYFRPHPLMRREPWRLSHEQPLRAMGYLIDTFSDPFAIRTARVCITWASNASVDALLNGVPIVCLSELNVAWEVAEHDLYRIDSPGYIPQSKRQALIERLAWCQWTVEEFANGTAWRQLRRRPCSQSHR